MENLNTKIRRGFNGKLDSELYIQLDRQSYWDYRNYRNLIRNQLESRLYWQLDSGLDNQLKTQMEHGKFE
jgi:hypothetical protein